MGDDGKKWLEAVISPFGGGAGGGLTTKKSMPLTLNRILFGLVSIVRAFETASYSAS